MNEPSCTNSRKELRRNCSPIGHNNTKHFLCSIRSRHPLEFFEITRRESVPGGSFAHTWKLFGALSPDPTDCPWVSEDGKRINRMYVLDTSELSFYRITNFFMGSLTFDTGFFDLQRAAFRQLCSAFSVPKLPQNGFSGLQSKELFLSLPPQSEIFWYTRIWLIYSRLPITRSFKENRKTFGLSGARRK